MTINDYIEDCRQKRQGKSFAFLAERCETSAEAPYRIRPAGTISADENLVLVLAGTGGKGVYLRGYNSMLKKVDRFVQDNLDNKAASVRVCVAVCDFGKYHFDKTARKGAYFEAYWPQHLAELRYNVPEKCREETFNPAYVQDIFDAAILPRIAQEDGKRRFSQTQALQNIRRLNIVGHCHGGYVALQLEKMMNAKMAELGYSEAEQEQLKSQLLVLAYNPDCPKHTSKLRFISIESAQDAHNEYNNYIKEWLLMAPKDFGVCYLTKDWGRTLMCSQFGKAGVEKNPRKEIEVFDAEEWFSGKERKKTLSEHDFLGFEAVENMSRSALRLQLFANNILKNAVRNSQKQGGDKFVPLPKIQNLAADNLSQKCDFARAAITGCRLERGVMRTDRSQIDAYANWRRSIPRVELD